MPWNWEYRTIKLDAEGWLDRQINFESLDAKLNSLGEEGWELVSIIHVVNTVMMVDSVIAFLKRPAAALSGHDTTSPTQL